MTITFDWYLFELAFVVATAFLGFIIGWKYMAIWVVGVFFAMMISNAAGPRLGTLTNRLLSFGASMLSIVLGRPDGSITAPQVTVTDVTMPLWQSGLFMILVLFAGWMSRALGNSIAVGLLGKIMGAIFGALGTVMVLSTLSTNYQNYVAAGGRDYLANSLSLGVPTVTVGGTSGAGDWAGLATVAFALFLTLFVIYVIWRVVRLVL